MNERELANMAQRAQIQASGMAATRLHVSLELYKVLLSHYVLDCDTVPSVPEEDGKALGEQAIRLADGLMRGLGLIA